jgi:septal ring factor EnvC (AmiA/AmiB activator)
MNNYVWILQIVTTLFVGIIAFWIKDWKTKTEKQIQENASSIKHVETKLQDEIKNIDKSLNEFKTQMPYNYTLREDHIRANANLEKRLEKMENSIDQKLTAINSRMEQKLDDYFKTFSQRIDRLDEHLDEHIHKKEG